MSCSRVLPGTRLFHRFPHRWGSLIIGVSFLLLGLATVPECAAQKFVDVSSEVTITKSGLVYNRLTNTFNSLLTVTNRPTSSVLNGPLFLIISDVTPGTVTLANQAGLDSSGNPYIVLAVPPDGLAPERSITNTLVEFRNPNRVSFTFNASVAKIAILPQPLPEAVVGPLIESLPPAAAVVGKPVQYQVIAESAKPESLLFSLSTAPPGMTIDGNSGLILWTPAVNQSGDQSITVVAKDSEGQDSQSFTLSVYGTGPVTSALVTAASGGVITVDDPASKINGLSIHIPAGALAANTKISIMELIPPPTLGGTHRFLMKGFSVEPDGISLAIPAKITVPYSTDEFDTSESIPLEDFLGAYFLQSSTGGLQFMDSFSVDKVNHVVSGAVPHFSVYVVSNIARLCPPPTTASDCPKSYSPMWPSNLAPVVLVHGFQLGYSHASSMGDEGTWGQLRYLFEQLNGGILSRVDAWRFDWDSAYTPFETSAGNLAKALKKVESLHGTDHVDLVAHSFGGILVRTYLEGKGTSYNNDVSRVMTLGSPHQGIGGPFSLFFANACANTAQFTGQPKTCFEVGTGQQNWLAGLIGEGKFLLGLNSSVLPVLEPSLKPQYSIISGKRNSCATLKNCVPTFLADDGLITAAGNKLCGSLNGLNKNVCSAAPVSEQTNTGLCHSGALIGSGFTKTCPAASNIPMAQIDSTSHPLWKQLCVFVGGCSLVGDWAGTSVATFDTGETESVPVSASFSSAGSSINATVVFTEPGDVPDINKGSGSYQLNGPNFNFTITAEDEKVNVIGTVSTGPNGLVLSGSGKSSSGDGGSGTITPQTDGFNMSGSLTITETPGNAKEQESGSAKLTMSPDGNHMKGTATVSDGTQVTWCLDKVGTPKSCQ
jgi:pimeloyl-ACP methyl ester carboxylesterase